MNEDKPLLDKITYEFLQEPNTNGTTGLDRDEKLTITMESVIGSLDEDGGFYVIRTDGWSINNSSELLDLFNQIKNIKHEKD